MAGDLHLITSCDSSFATLAFLPEASHTLSRLLLRNVRKLEPFLSPRAETAESIKELFTLVCVERSHPLSRLQFTPHPHTGGRVQQAPPMSLFLPLAFLNSYKKMQPITAGSGWPYARSPTPKVSLREGGIMEHHFLTYWVCSTLHQDLEELF